MEDTNQITVKTILPYGLSIEDMFYYTTKDKTQMLWDEVLSVFEKQGINISWKAKKFWYCKDDENIFFNPNATFEQHGFEVSTEMSVYFGFPPEKCSEYISLDVKNFVDVDINGINEYQTYYFNKNNSANYLINTLKDEILDEIDTKVMKRLYVNVLNESIDLSKNFKQNLLKSGDKLILQPREDDETNVVPPSDDSLDMQIPLPHRNHMEIPPPPSYESLYPDLSELTKDAEEENRIIFDEKIPARKL